MVVVVVVAAVLVVEVVVVSGGKAEAREKLGRKFFYVMKTGAQLT